LARPGCSFHAPERCQSDSTLPLWSACGMIAIMAIAA
jgi:hypothetical protein